MTGNPPFPHPVPNRVETKRQTPREEMLPLLMIGMVESTLDIAKEALQSDTAVQGGAAHEFHGFFDGLDRRAPRSSCG